MATSSEPPLPGFVATQLRLSDKGTDKNRCAVKTLARRADGSIHSDEYDNGYRWLLKPFDAGADFERMAHELDALARTHRVILGMGEPKPGLDLNVPHRRLWAQSNLSLNTMIAAPRAWLPVDVDNVVVPHGLGDPERYVEGAIFVRDTLLPEEFRATTTVVSPSAKTGLKGPTLLRCRLWFLLDRVHELSALRDWTLGLKILVGVGDAAIIQIAQPIYVGRPRFIGMTDPIPPRLWAVVAPGSRDRVALVAERYAPKVIEIERKIGLAAAACGADWKAFLAQTLGGELGFYLPLSRGLGLAARSSDRDDAIIVFTSALLAKRADPGRIRDYGKAWLGRTIARFRAKDGRVQAARAAASRQLYGE